MKISYLAAEYFGDGFPALSSNGLFSVGFLFFIVRSSLVMS